MKKITIMNAILTVIYIAIFAYFKITGYITGVLFGGLPNMTYLFVGPILGIITLFNATLIVLHKAENKWQAIYKWSSLVLLVILTVSIFTLPWTYITFGSSLQLFIQIVIIMASCIMTLLMIYMIWKHDVLQYKKEMA